MDTNTKKVLCCSKMKMAVENYGGVFPELKPKDKDALNALADRTLAVWEEGFAAILGMSEPDSPGNA